MKGTVLAHGLQQSTNGCSQNKMHPLLAVFVTFVCSSQECGSDEAATEGLVEGRFQTMFGSRCYGRPGKGETMPILQYLIILYFLKNCISIIIRY